MPQRVPVLKFIHELRAAGLDFDYVEVLRDPQAYWRRLTPDRRSLFLALHEVTAPPAEELPLRVEKRRGRPADQENVYLVLEGEEKASGAARFLREAQDRVLYEPLHVTVPEHADDEDEDEEELVPVPVDAPVVGGPGTFDVLLDVWDGDPPGPDDDLCATNAPPFHETVEEYWVDPPFARIRILRDPEGALLYNVEEPRLDEMEKALYATVNERLRDTLILEDSDGSVDDATRVATEAFRLLKRYGIGNDSRAAFRLGYHFIRNYLGFGRLTPIMRDDTIEDISCNGADVPLFVVHQRHQKVRTNLLFESDELDAFTIKLAERGGKLLSVAEPIVDATLPDGSRIQATHGREVTSRGSTFTIRKFREDPLTAVDLIRGGTHTLDTMAFLWLVVEMRKSLVVMGATASGKTTTLNCLSQFIPPTEKVVSIEDTREITLQHENWLPAITRDSFTGDESERITMYDLLRAALRQRPDYVIVGEIRGEEGLTLFQAMSTGHTCFSTMHAGSVENAVYRLENAPINVPRVMLTSLDFLLLQGQVELDGRPVRRMVSLTEVNGLDSASRNMRMNEIFRWDASTDGYGAGNASYVLDEARRKRGWTRSRVAEELEARKVVLDRLVRENRRHYTDVAKAVQKFYTEREVKSNEDEREEATEPVPVNGREREST